MRNKAAFTWFKENGFHEQTGYFFMKHSKLFNFNRGSYENRLASVEEYICVLLEEHQAKTESHEIEVVEPPQTVITPKPLTETEVTESKISGSITKSENVSSKITSVASTSLSEKRKELIKNTSSLEVIAKKQYEPLKAVPLNEIQEDINVEMEIKATDNDEEKYHKKQPSKTTPSKEVKKDVNVGVKIEATDADDEKYRKNCELLRQYDIRRRAGIRPTCKFLITSRICVTNLLSIVPWPEKYRHLFDGIMARHPEWDYKP